MRTPLGAMPLLPLVPPLLAAPPSHLRLWAGVLAVVIQLVPLWASLSLITSGSAWGWLAFPLFAYVPTLVVVRLVGESRTRLSRLAPGGVVLWSNRSRSRHVTSART